MNKFKLLNFRRIRRKCRWIFIWFGSEEGIFKYCVLEENIKKKNDKFENIKIKLLSRF